MQIHILHCSANRCSLFLWSTLTVFFNFCCIWQFFFKYWKISCKMILTAVLWCKHESNCPSGAVAQKYITIECCNKNNRSDVTTHTVTLQFYAQTILHHHLKTLHISSCFRLFYYVSIRVKALCLWRRAGTEVQAAQQQRCGDTEKQSRKPGWWTSAHSAHQETGRNRLCAGKHKHSQRIFLLSLTGLFPQFFLTQNSTYNYTSATLRSKLYTV